MGIGFVDSIVVYNRYVESLMETEYYIGTRFDNVRVELTQGANIRESGIENADACRVKIPNDGSLPKPYIAPKLWQGLSNEDKLNYFTLDKGEAGSMFFAIVKKAELGIDIDLPVGLIKSDPAAYRGGFYQFIRGKYGYTYTINTINVYSLIPRFEVSGN